MKGKFKEKTADMAAEKAMKFPKLMISKDEMGRIVVLFTKHCKGVVVAEDRFEDTGNYEKDWSMECFEDFHGKVVIKQ